MDSITETGFSGYNNGRYSDFEASKRLLRIMVDLSSFNHANGKRITYEKIADQLNDDGLGRFISRSGYFKPIQYQEIQSFVNSLNINRCKKIIHFARTWYYSKFILEHNTRGAATMKFVLENGGQGAFATGIMDRALQENHYVLEFFSRTPKVNGHIVLQFLCCKLGGQFWEERFPEIPFLYIFEHDLFYLKYMREKCDFNRKYTGLILSYKEKLARDN